MPISSRIKRQFPHIDMAAMSAVAFILLAFLMLTGRFRNMSVLVEADLPAASSMPVCSMIDNEYITVTIKHKKVFIGFSSDVLQKQTLQAMAAKYHLNFNREELDSFSKLGNFGDSLSEMKDFIRSCKQLKSPAFLKGIPIDDSKSNQFFNWVEQAQFVYKKQTGKKLQVVIAGDQAEGYPLVKQIIANLQRQDINKFSLMAIQKKRDI